MSTDYLTLGPTPSDEDCAQVGSDTYARESRCECIRFRNLLAAAFPPPLAVHFGIKVFPHDFGSYREVVVIFEEHNEEAVRWSHDVERNIPTTWSELEALAEKGTRDVESKVE